MSKTRGHIINNSILLSVTEITFKSMISNTSNSIINYKIMEFEVLLIIWFKIYLCNRQHYTVINNVSSCFTPGVPQGSTLGPLLFFLYVNDISRVLPGEKVKLFADDTNLFISGLDVNTLNQKTH